MNMNLTQTWDLLDWFYCFHYFEIGFSILCELKDFVCWGIDNEIKSSAEPGSLGEALEIENFDSIFRDAFNPFITGSGILLA